MYFKLNMIIINKVRKKFNTKFSLPGNCNDFARKNYFSKK